MRWSAVNMRFAVFAVWAALIAPMIAFGAAPAVALASAAPRAPYEPGEHDFHVAFPGAPKASLRLVGSGRERSYMDNEGDQLFMVSVADVLFGEDADDEAYGRRLERFADGLGAFLTSRRQATSGGETACEAAFATTRGQIIVVRMIVHDKRLYQVMFQGQNSPQVIQRGERFLDSFELTDR